MLSAENIVLLPFLIAFTYIYQQYVCDRRGINLFNKSHISNIHLFVPPFHLTFIIYRPTHIKYYFFLKVLRLSFCLSLSLSLSHTLTWLEYYKTYTTMNVCFYLRLAEIQTSSNMLSYIKIQSMIRNVTRLVRVY